MLYVSYNFVGIVQRTYAKKLVKKRGENVSLFYLNLNVNDPKLRFAKDVKTNKKAKNVRIKKRISR